MKVIKEGSSGNDVKKWQYFLMGHNFYSGLVSGQFDPKTTDATRAFQLSHKLNPDGIVGNFTLGQAMLHGFGVLKDEETDITSTSYPAKPNFEALATNQERQEIFGPLEYISDPTPDNPENIKITNGWDKENIVNVNVPQIKAIKGSDIIAFHKKAADQLKSLFNDWEKNELIPQILAWNGSYVARYVRGSQTRLSNHAFGTAFDINYPWNKLGSVPPVVGQEGSVRDLVEIANQNGFFWGGHYSTRYDGMHFEIAKIL